MLHSVLNVSRIDLHSMNGPTSKAKGWTQGQLALMAGVDRTTFARIEAGRHRPRKDHKAALEQAFLGAAKAVNPSDVKGSK